MSSGFARVFRELVGQLPINPSNNHALTGKCLPVTRLSTFLGRNAWKLYPANSVGNLMAGAYFSRQATPYVTSSVLKQTWSKALRKEKRSWGQPLSLNSEWHPKISSWCVLPLLTQTWKTETGWNSSTLSGQELCLKFPISSWLWLCKTELPKEVGFRKSCPGVRHMLTQFSLGRVSEQHPWHHTWPTHFGVHGRKHRALFDKILLFYRFSPEIISKMSLPRPDKTV